MDKDNKRAQRRKDEQTIWMRRLNNAFNNSKYYVNNGDKYCLKNINTAHIPEDLKNSKYGMLLKNTANPQTYKNVGKHLDNKHEQKIERREGKKIINDAIINYNNRENEMTKLVNELAELYEDLKACNKEINNIEEQLAVLPEKHKELLQIKREIEEKICWFQIGNNNI